MVTKFLMKSFGSMNCCLKPLKVKHGLQRWQANPVGSMTPLTNLTHSRKTLFKFLLSLLKTPFGNKLVKSSPTLATGLKTHQALIVSTIGQTTMTMRENLTTKTKVTMARMTMIPTRNQIRLPSTFILFEPACMTRTCLNLESILMSRLRVLLKALRHCQ